MNRHPHQLSTTNRTPSSVIVESLKKVCSEKSEKAEVEKAAKLCEEGTLWNEAINCYKISGNYEKVAELLEKLEEFRGAAKYYEKLGKFEKAAELYEGAEAYLEASGVYYKLGDLAKTAETLNKAGKKEDSAKIYESIREFDASAKLYEEIMDFCKAAIMWEKDGNLEKAIIDYWECGDCSSINRFRKEAIKTKVENKEALDILQWCRAIATANCDTIELLSESYLKNPYSAVGKCFLVSLNAENIVQALSKKTYLIRPDELESLALVSFKSGFGH